jgi:hypothetical protein
MFRAAILLWCALPLLAQTAPRGTEPKLKAADYPAHALAGDVAIGAEYMVHTFGRAGQTFVADKYLTVEVALYPPRGESLMVSTGNFSLRLNGKKQALVPQAPGFVAASLKYPDWQQERRLEGYGGIGNAGVIIGRPRPTERFPGDPTARTPLPPAPRAPEPDNPSGMEKQPPSPADVVAVESSLPEGPASGPVSGSMASSEAAPISEFRLHAMAAVWQPMEDAYRSPPST